MKALAAEIQGMHREGGANAIKALLKTEPGVRTSTVSFKKRNARILFDSPATSERCLIVNAIGELIGVNAALGGALEEGQSGRNRPASGHSGDSEGRRHLRHRTECHPESRSRRDRAADLCRAFLDGSGPGPE